MASGQLVVFVSSSLTELGAERQAARDAVRAAQMEPWLWELDAGARPESPRRAFLHEVSNADVFVGIFGSTFGEYTKQEYDRARAERKPCFLYFKGTADLERTAELKRLFDEKREALSDHTIGEFANAAALGSRVRADLIRWQAELVREKNQRQSTADEIVDWSVETIRAHVQRYHIEEYLEKTTAAAPLFEVPVTARQGRRLGPAVVEPDLLAKTMTADEFVETYALTPSRVTMIVGAAGNGKTLLMTRLVQRTLQRSRSIAPAVVRLASWRRGTDFQSWLIKALADEYLIGLPGGAAVLNERRAELFLDGLDEVPHDQRAELGHALLAYLASTAVRRVVMCCRSDAYDLIASELTVDLLVTVEAMSSGQVEQALAHLPASWAQSQTASAVAGRLTSPLLLSVASKMDASQIEGFLGGDATSGHTVQRQVLESYLRSTLSSRSSVSELDTQVLAYSLSWLAQLTTQTGYLELERMQPAWLRRMSDRLLYVLVSRVFSGAVTGVTLALAFMAAMSAFGAVSDDWWDVVMYAGPAGAVSSAVLLACDGLWLGFTRRAPTRLRTKKALRVVKAVGPGLVAALCFIWLGVESVFVLPIVLGSAVISAVRSHGLDGDIRPRARFDFTWSRVVTAELVVGLGYAVVAVAVVVVGFQDWNLPGVGRFADPGRTIWMAIGTWLFRGLAVTLVFGLPVAMVFASRARTIETTHFPNEGIWNALKAALYSFIIVGTVASVAAGFFLADYLPSAVIGLCVGVVVALWSGGLDVAEHWLVRALMFAESGVPIRSVLHWGQEAGILRMFGGRCTFAHALLEECALGLAPSAQHSSPRSMAWIRSGLWAIAVASISGLAIISWTLGGYGW